jgi:hypothetical protein
MAYCITTSCTVDGSIRPSVVEPQRHSQREMSVRRSWCNPYGVQQKPTKSQIVIIIIYCICSSIHRTVRSYCMAIHHDDVCKKPYLLSFIRLPSSGDDKCHRACLLTLSEDPPLTVSTRATCRSYILYIQY